MRKTLLAAATDAHLGNIRFQAMLTQQVLQKGLSFQRYEELSKKQDLNRPLTELLPNTSLGQVRPY